MRRMILKNFRIVDEAADFFGSLIVEDGLIKQIIPGEFSRNDAAAHGGIVIDGSSLCCPDNAPPEVPVLMPAFIDLHAHFRDPGIAGKDTPFPAETLESGAFAAAAGGYGTVVCMANTNPVIDSAEKARRLKDFSDALGLIDLYPAVSLTKNMDGRELTGIAGGEFADNGVYRPLLLSEDGKDIADDSLFLAALRAAGVRGIPVSCHCDFGGAEAEAAKAAGRSRAEWSRIEENNAVRRAVELGKAAPCYVHIAHVSTAEAAAFIRQEKKSAHTVPGFALTCEAAPHHIGATDADAHRMGGESFGRVNPPLRTETDRRAIIAALDDGTIDAIATDHAPHSETAKAAGAPGFSGLETAFAVCLSHLPPDAAPENARNGILRRLSALMSANPARILALAEDRGRIAPGMRADLVVADSRAEWNVDAPQFKSRGKCSPFNGRTLRGKILLTVHRGRIVFGGSNAQHR